MVPPEQVEAFRKEMTDAGADFRVVVYPGAAHSFTNPDARETGNKYNMPIAYNEKADKESWKEMQTFLKGDIWKVEGSTIWSRVTRSFDVFLLKTERRSTQIAY